MHVLLNTENLILSERKVKTKTRYFVDRKTSYTIKSFPSPDDAIHFINEWELKNGEKVSNTHDHITIPNRILALQNVGKVIDFSYRNDELPSFCFGPQETIDGEKTLKYRLWIDTREKSHSLRISDKRFLIELNDISVNKILLSTDDIEKVIKFIEDHRSK